MVSNRIILNVRRALQEAEKNAGPGLSLNEIGRHKTIISKIKSITGSTPSGETVAAVDHIIQVFG